MATPSGAVDLAALGDAVGPLALAGERLLPVPDSLADLFPEGGLVRGRTVVCDGTAATTLALTLVAPAIVGGSWLAMVDLPTIGLDAARELGVALERVVGIHTGGGNVDATTASGTASARARRWPEVVAAAADGFDVVIACAPHDVSPSVARTVVARIRQRGVVLILLGDPAGIPIDGVLRASTEAWSGLGDGHGHLRERRLTVEASGRRIPGRRSCHVALPALPASVAVGPPAA